MATDQPMPPAVILGGDSNALSAARTLTRLGARVYAAGGAGRPLRHSNAPAEFAALGDGREAIARWLDWLLERRFGGVLIPCSDDGLELLVGHGERLREAGYRLPEIDLELAAALLDKDRTLELARPAGILTPRTLRPRDLARIEDAVDALGLPFAIKPLRSRPDMPPGLEGKAFVVRSREDLVRTYTTLLEAGIEVQLTEIVPGPDTELTQFWSYRTPDGRLLLELAKHKVRQFPPRFGTGCYQVIRWDEDVAEAGRAFVERLGVVGFSSVEFKRRPSDGALVLIECNYRLIDANELGRVAGVDAARVVYERALGREVAPLPRPREAVGFWHPVRDLRSMLAGRREGELTVRGWARSLARRQVTPYFSPRDPRPSVAVGVRRLRRHARRPS